MIPTTISLFIAWFLCNINVSFARVNTDPIDFGEIPNLDSYPACIRTCFIHSHHTGGNVNLLCLDIDDVAVQCTTNVCLCGNAEWVKLARGRLAKCAEEYCDNERLDANDMDRLFVGYCKTKGYDIANVGDSPSSSPSEHTVTVIHGAGTVTATESITITLTETVTFTTTAHATSTARRSACVHSLGLGLAVILSIFSTWA